MAPLNAPLHVRQVATGHCLPACAEMALAQLGIKTTQIHLAPQLATRTGLGTPFSKTVRIEALGIRVQLAEWSGMDMILHALEQGQAVIAAIMTTPDLPGWGDLRTQHAVLVIHVDV